MEKLRKVFFLFLFLFLFVGCSSNDTWTYKDLPNDYAILKTGEVTMAVGKYRNQLFDIKNGDKKIGFEEYVAEFQKGNQYVGFKCAKSKDAGIEVFFYLIDTENEDLYGPYEIESTYEAVTEKIVDEELGEWIKTSTIE